MAFEVPKSARSWSAQADTRLYGAALAAARLAWAAITLLAVGLFLLGIPAEYAAQHASAGSKFHDALAATGISQAFFAGYRTALDVALALLFALTGIFIFWRKSDDWMVMLVSVANITFGALFVPTLVRLMEAAPGYASPVALVRSVGLFSSLVVFYYLFPDGRYVPGWLRWLSLAWGILVLGWLFFPELPLNLVYLETWFANPVGALLLYLAWYASGTAAQIYRYRRVSNATQRQQTKWVLYGLVGALTGFLLYQGSLALLPSTESGVPRLLHILIGVPIYHLFILLVPVTMSVSILRYRLWDIDFLINRTLVYGLLSGILVAVYIVSVVLISQLLRLTYGGPRTQLVTVISTLLVAVIFSPLRARVQNAIDRRFYRRKYDAARALAEFSLTVRDEVDLDRLSEHLRQVVERTLNPSHISLWLSPPEQPEDLAPGERIQRLPAKPGGQITWSELTGRGERE